ncbi:hypothetical protein ACFY2H_05800 [Streptomyces griseofuscus]|uniref:hypothetical protein n=1 Tax=Streptomyces griseofuscus TaxID=146922 RepID=UPI00369D96E6
MRWLYWRLVERVRPEHEQRTVVLTASTEALNLLERYDRASTAALTRVVEKLSDADRGALRQALPALELDSTPRFCLFGQRRVQMRMPARWSAAW